MTEMVKFEFDGDTLDVVPEAGTLSVVVKRFCENLGVQAHPQAEKLKALPWAVTRIIRATGPDGKNYESFCLDLESLPMWLATINPGKVRAELRPKLIRYQRECARVLRDHFLGRTAPAAPTLDAETLVRVMAQVVAPVLQAVQALATAVTNLSGRVSTIEDRSTLALVDPRDASWLLSELRSIAQLEVALKLRTSFRSAHRRLQNELGAAVQWVGSGRSWKVLPSASFPFARAWVVEKRAAVSAACEATALSRQLTIDDIDLSKTKH